jgi:ribosomal protein S18 acetylase RimI-like enzyme
VTSSSGLRESAWASYPAILALGGSGAPHRSTRTFGAVTCANFGVPHSWGVQAATGSGPPSDDDLRAAVAWMQHQGASTGWRIAAPEALLGRDPWPDLVAFDRMGIFAMSTADAGVMLPDGPPELVLDHRPSYEDVQASYGGWMQDPALARLLVTPADMDRARRRFVVGLVDGAPVGCGCVWWADDAAYLSAIGVVEPMRGRGYGRALTAAAARLAVTDPPAGRPGVVWLHATDDAAGLYDRMGFERVDTEVALGPTNATTQGHAP